MSRDQAGIDRTSCEQENENMVFQDGGRLHANLKEVTSTPLLSNQIRMLILENIVDLVIHCRLEVFQLPDNIMTGSSPPYQAVSYAWGNSEERSLIICNGKPVNIMSNLCAALFRIWSKEPEFHLWTDYLCISQFDIHEKNAQVKLMGRIFSRASRVIVWLGPQSNNIQQLWSLIQSSRAERVDWRSDQDADIHSPLSIMKDPGLVELAAKQWFYRAWTFQEIKVARDALLICGDLEMPWRDFWSFCTDRQAGLGRSYQFTGSQKFYASILRNGPPSSTSQASSPASTFSTFLLANWQRDATDPHDKVFSLLSPELYHDAGHGMTADYAQPLRETYIQAARACINVDRSLAILRNTESRQLSGWRSLVDPMKTGLQEALVDLAADDINLPSWVPDWRIHHAASSSAEGEGCHRKPAAIFEQFDKGDVQWYSGAPVQDMSDISDGLKVEGLALGILEAQGLGWPTCQLLAFPECAFAAAQLSPMPGVVTDQFHNSTEPRYPGLQTPPSIEPKIASPRFAKFRDAVDDHHKLEHDCAPRYKQHLYGHFARINSTRNSQSNESVAPVKSGDWLCLLDGGYAFFILRPISLSRESSAVELARKFLFITRVPTGWAIQDRPTTGGPPQMLVDFDCVAGTFELV